jgi:hypothetical protein
LNIAQPQPCSGIYESEKKYLGTITALNSSSKIIWTSVIYFFEILK